MNKNHREETTDTSSSISWSDEEGHTSPKMEAVKAQTMIADFTEQDKELVETGEPCQTLITPLEKDESEPLSSWGSIVIQSTEDMKDILEESDTRTPVFKAAPASVTDESAIRDKAREAASKTKTHPVCNDKNTTMNIKHREETTDTSSSISWSDEEGHTSPKMEAVKAQTMIADFTKQDKELVKTGEPCQTLITPLEKDESEPLSSWGSIVIQSTEDMKDILEESDTRTPVFKAAPASVTDESAIRDEAREAANKTKTHPVCNDKNTKMNIKHREETTDTSSSISWSDEEGHTSPKMEAVKAQTMIEDFTEQDKELVKTGEPCQTLITPLEKDESEPLSSWGSIVIQSTEDMKDILEESDTRTPVFKAAPASVTDESAIRDEAREAANKTKTHPVCNDKNTKMNIKHREETTDTSSSMSWSDEEGHTSPKMEAVKAQTMIADFTEQDKELVETGEPCQTLITPLEKDESEPLSSWGSNVIQSTEDMKNIPEESDTRTPVFKVAPASVTDESAIRDEAREAANKTKTHPVCNDKNTKMNIKHREETTDTSSSMSWSDEEGHTSPKMEAVKAQTMIADFTEQDKELVETGEPCQTLITPLEKDESEPLSSWGSNVIQSTEDMKNIPEESDTGTPVFKVAPASVTDESAIRDEAREAANKTKTHPVCNDKNTKMNIKHREETTDTSSSISWSDEEGHTSPKMEAVKAQTMIADFTEQDKELVKTGEPCQTLITPLEKDESEPLSSWGSIVIQSTEDMKNILEESDTRTPVFKAAPASVIDESVIRDEAHEAANKTKTHPVCNDKNTKMNIKHREETTDTSSSMSWSDEEGHTSPKMEAVKAQTMIADFTEQDKELVETGEPCQTLITPLEKDESEPVSSWGSIVIQSTEDMKNILEENDTSAPVFKAAPAPVTDESAIRDVAHEAASKTKTHPVCNDKNTTMNTKHREETMDTSSSISWSDEEGQISPKMEAVKVQTMTEDFTEQDKELVKTGEPCQTLITPLEEDELETLSSGGRVIIKSIEDVKNILEDSDPRTPVFKAAPTSVTDESAISDEADEAASKTKTHPVCNDKNTTMNTKHREETMDTSSSISWSDEEGQISPKMEAVKVQTMTEDFTEQDKELVKTGEPCQTLITPLEEDELETLSSGGRVIIKSIEDVKNILEDSDPRTPVFKAAPTSVTDESAISDEADEAASKTKTHPECNHKKGQISPKMEAIEAHTTIEDLTEQDKELVETGEPFQTLITPLEEDESETLSSWGSFIIKSIEDVKNILEDQADDISVFDPNDDISLDELNLLLSSSTQDAEEVASDIISIIMKENKLDKTPKDKSGKTSWLKRVEAKMRVFFVHKFARESIFSFVAKLMSKFDCIPPNRDKASVKLLIEDVDYLVEDMIQLEEEQKKRRGTDKVCLYQRLDRAISSGQHDFVAKQLADIVFHHLKPDTGRSVHYQVEIQTEVDNFMKVTRKWLRQQGKRHRSEMDLVSHALRKIKVVVGLPPALIEAPLKIKSDPRTPVFKAASASTTDESAISDEADEAASKTKTHPACNDKNGQISPKMEAVKAQTTIEELTEQDKELVETGEPCQTPITSLEEDESETLSSGGSSVIENTEDVNNILEESDTRTPEFKAAPASVTGESTISNEAHEAASETKTHPVQEWDEQCCLILVSRLVDKILKNQSVDIPDDAIKTSMKEMLLMEIAGCNVAVKPRVQHIKRTVKAVHKDLCKNMDKAEILQILLSQDVLLYECIIEALKKHLVTPKENSGINRLFKSVFRTVAKPFSAFFKRGSKE